MTGILQAILSFFGVQASSSANYIEDVFSTYLYTGNSTSGGTQTITNNIDLSTKGGMVWIKGRSAASDHILTDTARGAGTTATNNQALASNLTSAEDLGGSSYDFLSAFNTDGFTVKQGGTTTATRGTNYNAVTYSSWTFRKQAKFFDVVTYTGNGTNRTISHNLGSVPGTIIIKRTDTTAAWAVYHRSLANTEYLVLNTTAAKATGATYWNSTTPTSTEFSLGTATEVNASGGSATYVAYLFAHDAGGFGAAGSDNVISCGSYTIDAAENRVNVNLGYEPQWLMIKRTDSSIAGNWYIWDNMRGIVVGGDDPDLRPNSTSVEIKSADSIDINATGFTQGANATVAQPSATYIYIAIRRGPMKTPTSGTSVFSPVVYTGTNVDNRLVDMSLLTDMTFVRQRNDTVLGGMVVGDRLRGDPYLLTGTTAAEVSDADSFMTPTAGYGNSWSAMNGFGVGNDATSKLNASTTSNNQIAEGFRRAPGFFDVVCYTGNGADPRNITHNLGVSPQLVIIKSRNRIDDWVVRSSEFPSSGSSGIAYLNLTTQVNNAGYSYSPTSTTFSVSNNYNQNGSTFTYVAYLFASLAGVSKVGSYTGTGTTSVKQVDCGFTGGARFVLIKRTDSTGDWYVWDTARGIVSGNDPYLLLNSTAAEVTTTDWVDTYSLGFELSTASGNDVNINNATYIFLAIA